MNHDRLTASLISIIQTVSINKEVVGASMTLSEIGEHYLDSLDFELAVICFEAENRVVVSAERIPPAELASQTLRQFVELCTSDTDPSLGDSLFVTKRFGAFREALVSAAAPRPGKNRR